jgi:hypothetical protein
MTFPCKLLHIRCHAMAQYMKMRFAIRNGSGAGKFNFVYTFLILL